MFTVSMFADLVLKNPKPKLKSQSPKPKAQTQNPKPKSPDPRPGLPAAQLASTRSTSAYQATLPDPPQSLRPPYRPTCPRRPTGFSVPRAEPA